jgi:HK97 family phage major capsid protein
MSYTQAEVEEILNKAASGKMKAMTDALAQMADGVEKFKSRYDNRIDALETGIARKEFIGGGSSRGSVSSSAAQEHKDKFLTWARKGSDPEGLRSLEVQASLSTDIDPSGGYLVPIEMDKSIERLALDSLAMRRLARIKKTTGEYKKPLSKGGAGGGWVSERQERTETDTPELTLFSPPMSEMYALPEVTQKLLDMSDFDVAEWLIEEVNDVLISLEGAAFITGNGVGKPKGIIDPALMVANASWEYGKTGYIAGGHASLLNNADKLKTLKHAVKPIYRRNGVWLMNDTTQEVISKFKNGNGDYIWKEGLTEDAPDTLLGRPVEIDDNMPDIGADAYPIAFGDFNRAYTIVDHSTGIRLLRDPYTKKGFVKFYVTKRVAGGISNYQALKFMKIASA